MFEIEMQEGDRVQMSGRLDASQVDRAEEVLGAVTNAVRLDLSGLDYISSAGISVILRLHKRLDQSGGAVTLLNLQAHVQNVFHYAGLDQVLKIE